MKRWLLALVCLTLLLAPVCSADHAARGQWRVRPIASGGADLFGYFAEVALDPLGVPHVLFNDEDAGKVRFAVWDGAAWQISDAAPHAGYFCRLAYDRQGLLHGIYITATGDLRYGTYDGSWTWATVGGVGYGTYADLALNNQGHPYIAHIHGATGMLMCSWYDGATWHHDDIVTVGIDIRNFREIGMAVGPDGAPHISSVYEPGSAATTKLIHATRSNGSWSWEIVDGLGDRGKSSAILVDRANVTHITYRDSVTNNLRHAWLASAWQHEELDPVGDVGYHSSLALDRNGRLNVAYYDRDSDLLRFAWWDGDGWQKENLASVGKCRDATTSLVMDSAGQPHLIALLDKGSQRQVAYVYYDAIFAVSVPMVYGRTAN